MTGVIGLVLGALAAIGLVALVGVVGSSDPPPLGGPVVVRLEDEPEVLETVEEDPEPDPKRGEGATETMSRKNASRSKVSPDVVRLEDEPEVLETVEEDPEPDPKRGEGATETMSRSNASRSGVSRD